MVTLGVRAVQMRSFVGRAGTVVLKPRARTILQQQGFRQFRIGSERMAAAITTPQ
jgi:hypothetical protein